MPCETRLGHSIGYLAKLCSVGEILPIWCYGLAAAGVAGQVGGAERRVPLRVQVWPVSR